MYPNHINESSICKFMYILILNINSITHDLERERKRECTVTKNNGDHRSNHCTSTCILVEPCLIFSTTILHWNHVLLMAPPYLQSSLCACMRPVCASVSVWVWSFILVSLSPLYRKSWGYTLRLVQAHITLFGMIRRYFLISF